jgi:hypothetical protein
MTGASRTKIIRSLLARSTPRRIGGEHSAAKYQNVSPAVFGLSRATAVIKKSALTLKPSHA